MRLRRRRAYQVPYPPPMTCRRRNNCESTVISPTKFLPMQIGAGIHLIGLFPPKFGLQRANRCSSAAICDFGRELGKIDALAQLFLLALTKAGNGCEFAVPFAGWPSAEGIRSATGTRSPAPTTNSSQKGPNPYVFVGSWAFSPSFRLPRPLRPADSKPASAPQPDARPLRLSSPCRAQYERPPRRPGPDRA